MPSPIVGAVLERKRKLKRSDARDRIKITGRINDQFIAEPADGFGPPYPITERELVTAYGLKDAAEVESESEHERLIRIDAAATELAADKLFQGRVTRPEPDPASPEGVFAAAAAAAAAAEPEPDDA